MKKIPRLLLLVALWMGCSGNSGESTVDVEADSGAEDVSADVGEWGPDVLEYELFDTTHYVEDSTAAGLLSVEEGILRFAADNPFVAEFEVGDVVLAGLTDKTPDGLLVEIVALATEGDDLVVSVKRCPIQKAFRKLKVSFVRPIEVAPNGLNWADGVEEMRAGADGYETLRQGINDGHSFGPLNIDFYPFDGDEDHGTPEDQVHVVASFGGGLDFYYGMAFEWPKVWEGDFLPDIKVGFEIHANAMAHMSAEGIAAKDFGEEYLLGTKPLKKFWLGPLLFFPSIELWATVSGGSSSRYTMSMGAEAGFDAGLSYSTSSGGYLQPPTPTFEPDPIEVTAMESAHIKMTLGPKLKLALYGVFGPYAIVNAYAELEADSDRTPCWELKGGFEGEIGLELELWGYSLAQWGKEFGIFEWDFDNGSCIDDPLTAEVPDVTEPTFEPWSVLLKNLLVAWEPDRYRTDLSPVVDGTWLLAGDGVTALSKLSKDGALLWSRRFTREDAVIPTPLEITRARSTLDTGIEAFGYSPLTRLILGNDGNVVRATAPVLEFEAARGVTAMLELPGGGMVVAAPVVTEDMGNEDVWVTLLGQDLEPVWSLRWGEAGRQDAPVAMILYQGDIVLVGRSFDPAANPAKGSFVLRLKTDGTLVWAKDLVGCGGLSGVSLHAALESMDGDLIVGGNAGIGGPQNLLVKLKSDGSLGWAGVNSVSFLGIDLTDFVQLSDGGYLGAGTWWTASQDDLWLARMDSVGRMLWLKRYDTGVSDGAASIELTGQGGVMMAGLTDLGDDGKGSLWATRLPVQTGEFDFANGSTTVAEGSFDTALNACVDVRDSVVPILDFPVIWQVVGVVEETLSPIVEQM